MATAAGLQLEFSDGGRLRGTLENVNEVLYTVGAGISPLDLSHVSADVRQLLDKPSLAGNEIEQLRSQLVLSRARLLQVIADAERQPHVADGGELNTRESSHDHAYPQLYVAGDADYSRFDRFHVNTADDGTGTDEVFQLLCGGGLRVMLRMPTGGFVTLELDCPTPSSGWLMTYDGAWPHIGSMSRARKGTKVLVQVIGPPSWQIRYLDETENKVP